MRSRMAWAWLNVHSRSGAISRPYVRRLVLGLARATARSCARASLSATRASMRFLAASVLASATMPDATSSALSPGTLDVSIEPHGRAPSRARKRPRRGHGRGRDRVAFPLQLLDLSTRSLEVVPRLRRGRSAPARGP
mgnify:CR=1 FL=1